MFKKWMAVLGVSATMVAMAAPIEWKTDLKEAAAIAAQQNKLLLVEFTGSDWCTACILQKKNVLTTPLFTDWVNKNYVPVEIDVPRDAARVGGAAQLEKNKQVCDDFGVHIFPSLVVMSPELVLIDMRSGAQPTPERAIAELKKCAPVVAAYKNAMALQGEARARALHAIYAQQPDEIRKGNYPLLRLIAEADDNNVTGVRDTYQPLQQMRTLDKKLVAAGAVSQKLEILNAALAEAFPANERKILSRKEMLLRREAMRLMKEPTSVADVERARDYMLQVADCLESPAARAKLRKDVEVYYADPQALFNRNTQGKR